MTTTAQPMDWPGPRHVYVAPELTPRPKHDWGTILDRFILGIAGVATVGVGNWSVSTVLHDAGTPHYVAYAAAGIYDLLAAAAMWRTHRLRLTPHRALGPMLVMVLALIVGVAVNATHGWLMGGWMVAAVLGVIPVVFEAVWAMQHGIKPWTVRRHFKDEVRSMNLRDAHAALHGMTARLDALIAIGDAGTMPDVIARPLAIESGQADDRAVDTDSGQEDNLRVVRTDAQTAKVVRTGFQSSRPDTAKVSGRTDAPAVRTGGQANSVSGLVRDLLAAGHDAESVRTAVMTARPDSKPDSVSRVIRREMRARNA